MDFVPLCAGVVPSTSTVPFVPFAAIDQGAVGTVPIANFSKSSHNRRPLFPHGSPPELPLSPALAAPAALVPPAWPPPLFEPALAPPLVGLPPLFEPPPLVGLPPLVEPPLASPAGPALAPPLVEPPELPAPPLNAP